VIAVKAEIVLVVHAKHVLVKIVHVK
ncbi:uncharacterized protein METZ01_LOCUS46912, partial [marine metagenome]